MPNVFTRSSDVLGAKLLLDAAALVGLPVQPVERGRDPLLARRVGQQIAGELPGEELVVGQVVVERADDPVAIRRHVALDVGLVAVRVGVAREVEPVHRHPLAVGRRGQVAVDDGARRPPGERSAANASISAGVGGRPVRLNARRRMRVSGEACGRRREPSASRRARTNASIGIGRRGPRRVRARATACDRHAATSAAGNPRPRAPTASAALSRSPTASDVSPAAASRRLRSRSKMRRIELALLRVARLDDGPSRRRCP